MGRGGEDVPNPQVFKRDVDMALGGLAHVLRDGTE